MDYKIGYKNEIEFSTQLTEYLDMATISVKNNKEQYACVRAQSEITKSNGRPDIQLKISDPVEMEWRALSNPFYIECKTSEHEILKNLQQFVRYKYKHKSVKHCKLEKYGDFHIVATCPRWLTKPSTLGHYVKDNDVWLDSFMLTRVLWHLGVGVLWHTPTIRDPERLQIMFNEREKLNVFPMNKNGY